MNCATCEHNVCICKGTITGINTGDPAEYDCEKQSYWYGIDEEELKESGMPLECPDYEEGDYYG